MHLVCAVLFFTQRARKKETKSPRTERYGKQGHRGLEVATAERQSFGFLFTN